MPTDAAKVKILIADDNQPNVELLEAYLADLDCEIATAADGQAALAETRRILPDLLLLDIMMPRISGFEVCRQLKADPATRGIPILMVTSLQENADIDRGVEAGADDFLSKPIHKQVLLARVRALLEVRGHDSVLDRTLAYIRAVDRSA